MDVIERIERGVSDCEDAAIVRRLASVLLDALIALGTQAQGQAIIQDGLDALGKVLRERAGTQ